jgi:hypothetical protein
MSKMNERLDSLSNKVDAEHSALTLDKYVCFGTAIVAAGFMV